MKVLWLCNVLFPEFARQINAASPVSGGWLLGAAEALRAAPGVELSVCAAQRRSAHLITRTVNGITFYGYPASRKASHKYDPATEKCFRKLLEKVQPDLVHIWGTEFPHALAMTRAFEQPERTIISIQGLCGYYTEHYMAHLPRSVHGSFSFRDSLRRAFLSAQQRNFRIRGAMEAEALGSVKHIIGRTRWDRTCAAQTAPQAQYHFCNETLRESFYAQAGKWSLASCEKHSIFVSQASYPIKGFHLVLDAMPEILKRYPDAMLYTTGNDPLVQSRIGGYQSFLAEKIRKLGLGEHVSFLGPLDEQKMCERFLKSHVFVSASSIENSPNSLGEAMLLGVPVVASYVGGTMDLLRDGEEGFLYQSDSPYMLADHVCAVFADDARALTMGQKASAHAAKTHDRKKNLESLLEIYETIYRP